jgi:hypothetical protein
VLDYFLQVQASRFVSCIRLLDDAGIRVHVSASCSHTPSPAVRAQPRADLAMPRSK